MASVEQNLASEGLGTEGELASEAATEAFLDHELARTKQRLRRRSLEPGEWRPALLGETTWLSEDEYAALKGELFAIIERYRRDSMMTDPARRPAGHRGTRLFMALSAAPPLSVRGGAEPPGTQD